MNEGHRLAGKLKITKNMMNSHENEKARKPVPQRSASNESEESFEENDKEQKEEELDIENI